MQKHLTQKTKLSSTFSYFLVSFLILSGCAKELPKEYPDNFDRDYIEISSLTAGAQLKSENNSSLAFSTVSEKERGIYALNEISLRSVSVTGGASSITHFFNDLKIEAMNSGEKFKINFKMTHNKLIAYYEADGHEIGEAGKDLMINWQGKKQIALFHYDISSYGIVQNEVNNLGEVTNKVEYIETDKSSATHLKLSGLNDSRVMNGLRGYHDKKIISKKGLKNKTWSFAGLKKIIALPTTDANAQLEERIYKTKILNNVLYAQTPISYLSMSKFEQILFDKKDPRMSLCSKAMAESIGVINQDKCILTPVFQTTVTNAKLKLSKNGEGETLGTIEIDSAVENENSKFIILQPNTFAETVDLAKEAGSGLKEENTFSKNAFTASAHTSDSLSKLLNFPALNKIISTYYTNEATSAQNVLLQTKIFDSTIYIMLPKTLDMLSIVEKSAIGKTPLIEKCSKEIYQAMGFAKDNCVMAPIFEKGLSYSKLRFKFESGSQVPKVEVVHDVPKEQATIVVINSDTKFDKVEFGSPVFNFLDVLDKTAFQNKVMSKDEMKKRLNINLGSHKKGLAKIIDSNLWILVPVDKTALSLIEQGALGTDPRYQSCSEEFIELSGLVTATCVMKPLFYRAIATMKLAFRSTGPNDELKIPFPEASDEVNGYDFFMTTMSIEATTFNYNLGKEYPGKILTELSKHFDTNSKYLYVPMTMGTPREVVQAAPFYQGQSKVVKIYFAKTGIEVLEMDKDPRFRNNPLNNTPVLKLPGKYIDFECAKDKNGNCTSGVQEVSDREWNTKRYFMPSPENLQIQEQNFLDLVSVESDSCIFKIGTPKLIDYEIKEGVINIQLEKTYKTSSAWHCVADNYFRDTEAFSGFSTLGFKVQYFYSLVRLSDLASSDYEPIDYPLPEHGDFGYFKSKTEILDGQFDSQRKITKYYLNRWNPKKKTITYYMSDSYNQPDQKLIKEATYKAFETINATLANASSGIQLKLEEPAGKKVGDLRNNVLQLITDPLSNGLLGYAPSVKNPYTGEIVQGHVNMYSGVLKTLTRRVWESMVDLSIKIASQSSNATTTPSFATEEENGEDQESSVEGNETSSSINFVLKSSPSIYLENINHQDNIDQLGTSKIKYFSNSQGVLLKERSKLTWSKEEQRKLEGLEKIASSEMKRLNNYAKNNAYAVEFFRIAHTAKSLLPGISNLEGVFNEDGSLKRWIELNSKQKKKANDLILPYTYTSTLVHEMGHNLGLRHNFSGSFDAENFYSKEESSELELHSIPAYSSVMDYAVSTLNELTVFGKYDSAALRFGYHRSVELESGEFIPVTSTLTSLKSQLKDEEDKKLKGYLFCTDENAGLSTSCNRFDEGTSLVEVTKANISRYKDNYKYRNFRDGRNEFRAEGLGGYLVARYFEFGRIRDAYEEYEFFGNIFGKDLMIQGCSPEQTAQFPVCKMINDRRDVVKEIGNFFLEVLKTPDHLCSLATPEKPEETVELKKLVDIYDDVKYDISYVPTTCYDKAITSKLAEGDTPKIVKGEAGKFLNGFKDTDPDHPFSNDRAVRGVWVDKLIAMKSLFQRKATRGSTEKIHGALVDHPEIGRQVNSYIEHLVIGNNLENPIKFKDKKGKMYTEKYNIDLNYKIDGPQNGVGWVKGFFGLPRSGKAKLNKILLQVASGWGDTDDDDLTVLAKETINKFSVRKKDLSDIMNPNILQTAIGDTIFGSTKENSIAFYMINSMENLVKLNNIKKDVILKIIKARSLPEDLSENELAATKLPADLLDTLIQLATDGRVIPDDLWLRALGDPVLAANASKAYKLGTEGLTKIKSIIAGLEVIPEESTEEEKYLYSIGINDLNDYTDGKFQTKIDKFKNTLPLLPKNTAI